MLNKIVIDAANAAEPGEFIEKCSWQALFGIELPLLAGMSGGSNYQRLLQICVT